MPKKRNRIHRVLNAAKTVRNKKMYPVYAYKVMHPEYVAGELPVCWINQKTKEQWWSENAITSHNRGRVVRLQLNLPPKVQQSVAMGEGILMGAAEGKGYAVECAAAWSRDYAPYCNYPRMAA